MTMQPVFTMPTSRAQCGQNRDHFQLYAHLYLLLKFEKNMNHFAFFVVVHIWYLRFVQYPCENHPVNIVSFRHSKALPPGIDPGTLFH